MHMSDALISPQVGGTFWGISAALISYSGVKIKKLTNTKIIPLMGVMAAFIFAAQMVNFTIPGTGSSGHMIGALLLSILLGLFAGFLAISSVIVIQGLFFADGGLLAMGCNIFNMGAIACFIAYPLVYKPIVKIKNSNSFIIIGAILASIISLQLGSFSVVLQTLFSNITSLPFKTFLLLMQPIHLAIGLVEGVITASVILFVKQVEPDLINNNQNTNNSKKLIISLSIITILIAGIVSWYASSNPDGLEWSILKTTGSEELTTTNKIHKTIGEIQHKISIFPDYNIKSSEMDEQNQNNISENSTIDAGTSISGIVGSILTILFCVFIALLFKFTTKKTKTN